MYGILNYLVTTLTNEIIEDFVIIKDILHYQVAKNKNQKYIKKQQKYLKKKMKKQLSYDQWKTYAEKYDHLENIVQWKDQVQSKEYNYKYIQQLRDSLKKARNEENMEKLLHLVKSNCYRNVGNIMNPKLYQQAYVGTKTLIMDFQNEMIESLKYISSHKALSFELKYDFFNELRQTFGRSALVLSGGGLMGMYHLGLIFSLREKNLIPKVVSGSSVGSLAASFLCCTKFEDIPKIIDASYVNFQSFNQFRVQNTWSRNWQRLVRFLEKGFLLQINEVAQFMRDNMGDLTFIEAYEKTGYILNIQVTAMGHHEQSRLLNYITSPNVTIWSAVACSCSVPFIYCPNDLWIKNSKNELELFTEGIKYQDGSFSADLPLKTLSEMFNINGFIVSQVNPFVVPWDSDRVQYMRHQNKIYTRFRKSAEKLKQMIIDEVQHRFSVLDKINLFPKALKQFITIVTQNYKGDITIYPHPKLKQYLNILHNPLNQPDLIKYVEHGRKMTFCQIYQIDSYTKIERVIYENYSELRNTLRQKAVITQNSNRKGSNNSYNSYNNKYLQVFIDDKDDFSVVRDRALSKEVQQELTFNT